MKITIVILVALNLITLLVLWIMRKKNKEEVRGYRDLVSRTATALELYVINDHEKTDRLGTKTALCEVTSCVSSLFHSLEEHLPPQTWTLVAAIGKWKEIRGYGFRRVAHD